MALRIGYKASAEQFGPTELVDLAVAAEAAGLDSAFASDHFQPWRHEGGHAPHALTWMAAAGARTERIVLGTSVLTPSFRYNPAVLAQTFATMGCLYPGRVILGVGSGEALNEVAVGLDGWPDFKERFARLRESVRLMRQLWTKDRVTFEGDYYRTSDATIYDRPDTPIPVYVAAGGPTMAKYAGRMGDGVIVTSGKGRELYEDKLVPAIREGMSLAHKEPGDTEQLLEVKISYDRAPEKALENTRFWAPLALTAEQKNSLHDPIEMERAADELPIEQIASRWIVASDPQTVLDGIAPYAELGFTHFVVHAPGSDQRRFLSQFAEDVLPALREL
ncbi:glucose-6-phosphate dehydrogenase (coenzyme-F420) [Allobranchiibius sp. GilTou38]|uniref:glucose-6-phosphate dehydrogenase (coenzyme-F420) n=1 Tax=Allobranchiibius sp. GilTou38 TaxID=2815210 RepID=UPI001AA10035|nr:glucose-6-phosphate dehydrogenase (coenzyme-F420) [Allobranchiibius sp. GilTou38]MBO1765747.1 glucose-6-phosphate dehydrogenase (coenzyme-F420) [Allobranchiibius sp. GilTou38]